MFFLHNIEDKMSHVVKDLAGSDSIRRGACVTHKIEKHSENRILDSPDFAEWAHVIYGGR